LGLYAGLKYSREARTVEFDDVRVENVKTGWTGRPEVTELTAVEMKSGRPIPGLDPLKEGAEIDLARVGPLGLTICANTSGQVGTVVFRLNGKHYNGERDWPYTMVTGFGSKDSPGWQPTPGDYELEVIPWSGPPTASKTKGTGTEGDSLKIRFRVVKR
jgi:hypothetical protein